MGRRHRRRVAPLTLLLAVGVAEAQVTLIDTDFSSLPTDTLGGWVNVVAAQQDVPGATPSTLAVRELVDGTEPSPPLGDVGGAGTRVLTFDAGANNQQSFQRAEQPIASSIDPTRRVLVVEWDAVSTAASDSAEWYKVQLNFEDENGAGVELKSLFNTKAGNTAFGRSPNRVDGIVAAPNAADPFDRRTQADDAFLNFFNGIYDVRIPAGTFLSPPVIDDTGVLGHLFQQEAVIRTPRAAGGEVGVEWRVVDPFALQVGGTTVWSDFRINGVGTDTDNDGETDQALGSLEVVAIRLTRPELRVNTSVLPLTTAANENVRGSIASFPNSAPNGVDAALKNHQTGLSYYRLVEHHSGDVDRDGVVTAADVTATGLLSLINEEVVAVPDPALDADPGATVDRAVIWGDGDVNDDAIVTVADALEGVLQFVPGPVPTGPQLLYDVATGDVSIDTGGAELSGFSLRAAPGITFGSGDLSVGDPISLTTETAEELSWLNLTGDALPAGLNVTETVSLGAILSADLTELEFRAAFESAVFNTEDALSRSASFFATTTLQADFNGDGTVDLLDLDILGSNFGLNPATMAEGDANGDSVVDLLDLDILGSTFGIGAGESAVPEPAALFLATLATCGVGRRGRAR